MAVKSESTSSAAKLVVSRSFAARPEVVFDCWLNPEAARRWLFATPTGQMVRAEIDARVGGRFVFTDRRDGEDVEHVGEYLEIDRPRRLVFTFGVPKYSPVMTRVTIDMVRSAAGCDLTLTHEGVLPDWFEQTRSGWTKILETLATTLPNPDRSKEMAGNSAVSTGPDFVITRVFDAPRALLFNAWTDPRHLSQWWGPHGNSTCRLDVRNGGTWRIVMRGPDGAEYPVKGVYREIVEPERIVMTIDHSELPDDWHDRMNPGRDKSKGGPKLEILATVTFEERDGKTTQTLQLRFESAAVRDTLLKIGMSEGWSQSLERLRAEVAKMGTK
jgi:uncharacterized protein YndB with AHSA1/START domain